MKKPLRDNRWFIDASCRGMDPSIFYPEDPMVWAEAEQVRSLCAACPVRTECIDFSVTSRYQEEGWWGLPPADRKALRGLYRSSVKDYADALEEFSQELGSVDGVVLA